MKKIVLVCLVFMFASCDMPHFGSGSSGKTDEITVPQGLTKKLRPFDKNILEGYDSLDELREDLELVATEYLYNYIESKVSDGYYWSDDGFEDDLDAGATNDGASSADSGAENEKSSESDYDTNNQVSGVDEADSVKSDGSYIYLSHYEYSYAKHGQSKRSETIEDDYGKSYSSLSSILVYDTAGNQIDKVSSKSKTYGHLLISDSKLVAFSSDYVYDDNGDSHNTNRIEIYNKNSGKLTLAKTLDLPQDSYYSTARKIDSTVYVMSSLGLNFGSMRDEVYPWSSSYTNMNEKEYEAAAKAKVTKLAKTWAEDIVTNYFTMDDGSADTKLLENTVKIASIIKYDDEQESDYAYRLCKRPIVSEIVFVHSFSLDDSDYTLHAAASFTASSGYQYVYADSQYIVISHSGYRWWSWDNITTQTFLAAFAIEGSSVKPSSVGSVDGYLLNQFSMDRSYTHLRVATTLPEKWSYNTEDGYYEQTALSSNQVAVLDITKDEMSESGKVTDMGIDERIYSVRFKGDVGYVVTFKEVDPFYTLDLADPTNPKVAGELKVPGFSNYLHPIGEDYILGIGEEEWQFKIALYDVSDLSNPVETDKYIEEGWSYSESNNDHHAFRYVSSLDTLILPLSIWSYDYDADNFSGFALYSLGIETDSPKITRQASIELVPANDEWYYYSYTSPRSMLIDGNYIFIKEGVMASFSSDDYSKNWEKTL